jgi:DNA-directed RNA polymerase specialized sigma24 family protein
MPAGRISAVIDDLPDRGGQVMTLRDIEGLTSKEARAMLEISQGSQPALPHRAGAACAGTSGPDLAGA